MFENLKLPLFALIRKVDYNEFDGSIVALSANTPLTCHEIGGILYFPLFRSVETASRYATHYGVNDSIVKCDALRLRNIFVAVKPPCVAIDPMPDGDCIFATTSEFIYWMISHGQK